VLEKFLVLKSAGKNFSAGKILVLKSAGKIFSARKIFSAEKC
jgi:hypothetical protein